MSSEMIRFAPISAVFAILYAVGVRSVLQVDQSLLQQLKQIEGYYRLHQIHPLLYHHSPQEAIIELLLNELDFRNRKYELNKFTQEYFVRPCSEVIQLYHSHKDYFDRLPTVDSDPDVNMLCRLGLVVRDCNMYSTGVFVNDIFINLLRQAIKSFQRSA